MGITPIGRPTLNQLDLNDDFHDDGSIQRARRLWIRGDWHPPTIDPQINSIASKPASSNRLDPS